MEVTNSLRKKYSSNSPSDYDRYRILEKELKKEDRIEDIENIIRLMSPPKDIRSICTSEKGKKVRVAVIGAGLAGLASAYELKKIGCDITIFEASRRIGGRVYTHSFDRLNKYYGDFGEISIPASHYTTWHYINMFNLKTNYFINRNQYYYLRNIGAYNTNRQIIKNLYPKYYLSKVDKAMIKSKNHINILINHLKKLNMEERAELIEIKKEYSKKILDLDKISVKDAYALEGFTEEAINMISYINGIKEFYNSSFIELLQRKYTLDDISNYYIEGGMMQLPKALYKAINEEDLKSYSNINRDELGKVNVKLGFAVEEINDIKNKIRLKYIDLENNLEGNEEFDYLIITASSRSIKRIKVIDNFSSEKLRAIDESKFNNSQKVYLNLKERFWEKGRKNKKIIGGRTITDLPLYSIYYPSDNCNIYYNENNEEFLELKNNSRRPGVLLASYSLGDKADEFSYLDDNIKIEDIIRYIEIIHKLPKGYLSNILLDYKSLVWSDVQYIWGFLNLYTPTFRTLYSYSSISPEMDNKVFFAGDNGTVKHGTQQGSLQSGMIVANDIAKDILKKYY